MRRCRRQKGGVLRYCHSSPLRTILQLLCLHKCQHQALSALSAIVSAQSRNRIPFSVFRMPYSVCPGNPSAFTYPFPILATALNIIISPDNASSLGFFFYFVFFFWFTNFSPSCGWHLATLAVSTSVWSHCFAATLIGQWITALSNSIWLLTKRRRKRAEIDTLFNSF